MSLPDFPHESASIEERDEPRSTAAEPGDPHERIFSISHGPTNRDADAFDEWLDELLATEFSDVTVESVDLDCLYKDKSYADWNVYIEYRIPGTSTYRVPLNAVYAIVELEAESESDAIQQAHQQFDGEVITARKSRATATVELEADAGKSSATRLSDD